ncbi:hypothetical protein ACN38_g10314 [Penicillium nordicum]|uniref:Uncharacterized protein n=1 Tax=Penicillium nordicum TaxID=229535 RepID=A0A0M9WBS3_9EURO|nr:hypothetical protein ACN38_g10314 [Penicillium nordicum]
MLKQCDFCLVLGIITLSTVDPQSRATLSFQQPNQLHLIILSDTNHRTYDHRVWKTGLPVRSAVLKPHAGELVVGWVTTSESSLLYVFFCFLAIFFTFMEIDRCS